MSTKREQLVEEAKKTVGYQGRWTWAGLCRDAWRALGETPVNDTSGGRRWAAEVP
jgi:hypothetical protein